MLEVGKEYMASVSGVVNGGGVTVTMADGQLGLLRFKTLKEHGVYPEHETENTLSVAKIGDYIKVYDLIKVSVISVRVPGLPAGLADLEFVRWF